MIPLLYHKACASICSYCELLYHIMNKKAYPGTQSIQRVFSLLNAFNDTQPEWGLNDLAQAVDLNKTTAYRLLSALEIEGMVVRDEKSGVYRLGPGAIILGGRAVRTNNLNIVSHAELDKLAQATGETVTLEILVDCDVLIIDQVQGSHMLGAAQDIFTRWPAHATSTGKVLLAYLPEAQCEELLSAPLERYTENTITDMAKLQEELAQIRVQGYGIAQEELELGFVACAVPIFNHDGQVVAATSVGGPSTRFQAERLQEIVNMIVRAAGRISKKIGFIGSDSDSTN
jgi:DNA-binding IclR family transcriptional regulator